MNHHSLRFLLRSRTAEAHISLEAAVGDVACRVSYGRYLQGLFAFRAPVERALHRASWPQVFGAWRPSLLCHRIAADMADLGLAPCMYDDQPPRLATTADFLGVAYVLEGATLNAQMLFRAVQPLGLHGAYGARHLKEQVAALNNWMRFVAILENAQGSDGADIETAIRTSNAVFRAAERAMARVEAPLEEPHDVPAPPWTAPRVAAE